jgi:cobalt-zinc-cadmium efflux system outer membrane protein
MPRGFLSGVVCRPLLYSLLLLVPAALVQAQGERLPPVPEAVPQMRLRQPEARMPIDAEGVALDELHQLAMTYNPTLTKAAAAVDAARGNWLQVGLYPNPNVAYLGTQVGDAGTAGQQGGYVEQEFVRGCKLPLNRAVAAREIERAEQEFAAQRMRVINDVRIYFYHALVAQESLRIARELSDVAEKAMKAADDLFGAQEASRVDVLQARVEFNSAKVTLTNARNRYQAAWRRLAAVVGVPDLGESAVRGDLTRDMPEFSWEESIGRILIESPELAATRTGVSRAVAALRRARVEPIPNVTFQAGPQYDNNSRQPITNVNVIMSLPIFDYNQGNIRRAQADVRAARAEVARKELELTTRLASAFERYANARNQVEQYRAGILPNAREALELVAVGYRQGEIDYLPLLTTQRTFFNTSLAYLDATRDLWESSIAIDGLLLTDSLQAQSGVPEPSPTSTPAQPVFPFGGR